MELQNLTGALARHRALGAQITNVMNFQFQENCLEASLPCNSQNCRIVNPGVQGPWISPDRQGPLLIKRGGTPVFFEKSYGKTGDFRFNANSPWTPIDITERYDAFGYGSMFFAPFRAGKPGGGLKKWGLLAEKPAYFDSLFEARTESEKLSAYTHLMFLARVSSNTDVLARIYGDELSFLPGGDARALKREAYCNTFFDHGKAPHDPEKVMQFLDNADKGWAGPFSLPGNTDDPLTYNFNPFIPGNHVLVVPRTPFCHNMNDFTADLFTQMLMTSRDYIGEMRANGEVNFADQVNASVMLRTEGLVKPEDVDGMVFGWNFGDGKINSRGLETLSSFASQELIHFQLGPIPAGSYNRADRIGEICDRFNESEIDYLGKYIEAIRASGL
ncbi:MAG: hypothetical protein AABZ57_04845, partial [Candidatus Margulisiibacteriota bacterium]